MEFDPDTLQTILMSQLIDIVYTLVLKGATHYNLRTHDHKNHCCKMSRLSHFHFAPELEGLHDQGSLHG